MPRKTILIKLLVALSALGVSIRLNVPVYSLSLAFSAKGVAVKIARVAPDERRGAHEIAAQPSKHQPEAGAQKPESPTVSTPETPTRSAPAERNETSSQTATPADQSSASGGKLEAKIEFMNIAPQGTSVLAGRATPGAHVTIMENGQTVGTAIAGADGDWSLATEHRFASKSPSANLTAEARLSPPPTAGELPAIAEAKATPSSPSAAASMAPPSGPAADLINEFAAVVEAARQEAEARKAAEPAHSTEQGMAAEKGTVSAERTPSKPPTTSPVAEPQNPPSQTAARIAAATPSSSSASPRRSDIAAAPTEATPAGAKSTANAVAPQRPPAPLVIPIPMQFVYREATLTDDGEKAVALLTEYLKLKRFDAVTLSGHADERGGSDFNVELSRQRLEVIVARLRKGGYKGAVNLEPKGESQPFTAIDRSRFGRDDLFQLDRRVELRVAR